MKLELKTENENYLKSFSKIFGNIFSLALIIIFCNVAVKLGVISKHYQIYYNCRILSFDKSKSNFRKLSELSNLKNKQRIWEFCRDFVNNF
tara:strand:+ start:42 stop:314 length:273 start_codon:yes stop_codon:yes gene_type:complete